MDNWHVTSHLSLQLGLRYDACRMSGNETTRWQTSTLLPTIPLALPLWTPAGTIDPASPSVSILNSVPFYLNGMELAGVKGVPRGLVENRYNTLQPRVGFSDDSLRKR